ncbi:uncharacterized protein FOMMEDRAFT_164236 [Fomitiporia mediterranea MF3/22]|uniref:uncharacterized protein n=1 Tax=Fomitiporia mediterranea (strain MF3/22) TaxID=694068 RepID=UPI00044089A6|nr:uncharacterized protein FOMMEDRAFT_164236 [Fomitiporia mediterranea MF3/22]EJD07200.1 hypothetical protein FOMMEDRAFT_164236 [Fomitiporia mediterranea MF3/22]
MEIHPRSAYVGHNPATCLLEASYDPGRRMLPFVHSSTSRQRSEPRALIHLSFENPKRRRLDAVERSTSAYWHLLAPTGNHLHKAWYSAGAFSQQSNADRSLVAPPGAKNYSASLYPSREPTVKRLGLVRPDEICCAISVQRLRTLQQPGRGLDEGERSALLILSADEKFRACGSRYGWYALYSGFLPPTISAARLVIIRYGNHDYADGFYSQPVSERDGIFQLDTSSLRTRMVQGPVNALAKRNYALTCGRRGAVALSLLDGEPPDRFVQTTSLLNFLSMGEIHSIEDVAMLTISNLHRSNRVARPAMGALHESCLTKIARLSRVSGIQYLIPHVVNDQDYGSELAFQLSSLELMEPRVGSEELAPSANRSRDACGYTVLRAACTKLDPGTRKNVDFAVLALRYSGTLLGSRILREDEHE